MIALQWRPSTAEVGDARRVHGVALVVQSSGQQPRRRRLADAANAGEHEGVGDAAGREGVLQCADHPLLTDQVVEIPRTVFASEHGVGGCLGAFGRRRRRAAEHVEGRVVPFRREVFELGVSVQDVGHRPGVGEGKVETGRRPGVELVTAASFRT